MRRFLLRASLLVGSIFFSLMIVELLLWSEIDKKILGWVYYGVVCDTRSKLEVIKDFESKGHPAVPAIFPYRFGRKRARKDGDKYQIVPLAGLPHQLTVYCNELGYWATYFSDKHGFNNEDEYYNGSIDIVLIGDSFAQGACVKNTENVASWLRRKGFRTLNFGQGGNGPLLELATLVEYVRPIKAERIFRFYYEENDLNNLQSEVRNDVLAKYLEGYFSQGLAEKQAKINEILFKQLKTERARVEAKEAKEKQDAKANKNPFLFGNIRGVFKRLEVKSKRAYREVAPEVASDKFRDVLMKAKRVVNSWGGRLYFVYLPCWARYAYDYKEDVYHRRTVLGIVKELNIEIIDFHQILCEYDDPLSVFPYRKHGHYTPHGYKLLTDALLKTIKNEINASSLSVLRR